jgi:hypothetical protein
MSDLSRGIRRVFLDMRLIDQHNRDIVAYGVNTMALHAFQARLVGCQVNVRFAEGTRQNIQQLFTNGHDLVSMEKG